MSCCATATCFIDNAEQFATLDELHDRLCRCLNADKGTTLVGHKMLASAQRLKETVVNSRAFFVVLLRDPRDAALSYWLRIGTGLESYLEQWVRTVDVCQSLQAERRLIVIRYEDLVHDPQSALGPLSNVLGLTFNYEPRTLMFTPRRAAPLPWATQLRMDATCHFRFQFRRRRALA